MLLVINALRADTNTDTHQHMHKNDFKKPDTCGYRLCTPGLKHMLLSLKAYVNTDRELSSSTSKLLATLKCISMTFILAKKSSGHDFYVLSSFYITKLQIPLSSIQLADTGIQVTRFILQT